MVPVVSIRRVGPRLASFCLVVLATLGGLPGSAAAETSLAVEAGYGGYSQAGRPFPLLIAVTADVLFVGELLISSPDSGLAIVRQVEIPGGTTREFTVVWEGSARGDNAAVQLVAGGEVVASASARSIEQQNVDLVGVFPALADRGLPERAPLVVDAGEAMLFPVDPARLVFGWAVLEPLDIVVATAADLRGLDRAGLDALLAWVNRGGRLMVDEPVGTEIPGVPAVWQPDGARPQMAGQGEIVVTNGVAASGNWDAMFEPAPTRSAREDEGWGEFNMFWGFERLSWALGRDADVRLPSAGWLAAIVGAYVAVAGPGVWLATRGLRRPGLGWIMVPLAALCFAAVFWAFGSSFRNNAKTAHGTIVEVAPRGTVATTYSLMHSSGGGRDSISLPPGWSTVPSRTEGQRSVLDIVDGPAGSIASIKLDAGGFSVLGASGALPELDGVLEVKAWSSENGRVTGIVTNNLPVDLHEVAVFADLAGINVGTVPAGSAVEFDYSGQLADPFRGEPIEFRIWNDAIPPNFFGEDHHYDPGPVNLGLWGELNARWSLNSRPVGQVVVAAWTDELASPLDAEVHAGRTLLVARAAIEPDGGVLSDVAVPREIVRGPGALGSDFRMLDRWGGGAMVRFVLPDDARGEELVLTIPRAQRRIELWTGAEWRHVDLEDNRSAVLRLPPESIDNGRVYVKALFDFERGFPSLRELAVRSRRFDDDLSTLSFAAADAASGDQVGVAG